MKRNAFRFGKFHGRCPELAIEQVFVNFNLYFSADFQGAVLRNPHFTGDGIHADIAGKRGKQPECIERKLDKIFLFGELQHKRQLFSGSLRRIDYINGSILDIHIGKFNFQAHFT